MSVVYRAECPWCHHATPHQDEVCYCEWPECDCDRTCVEGFAHDTVPVALDAEDRRILAPYVDPGAKFFSSDTFRLLQKLAIRAGLKP